MTKRRSTKSALISSVLALVLCCSMLLGTTFAWFTDSVTSANNIIKTGTLNVEMYWSEGKDAPTDDAWKDASRGAIFNNTLWEPGYTEARHLKIANEGSLALKYQLAIIPNGDVSELADVIDVYYQSPAKQISADRQNLGTKVGTLADVIRTGIHDGALAAETAYTATIVLKMQESAGNKYQDKSIGTSFSIQLIATQMASENDSFGPNYDENAWAKGMVVHTANDLQAALNNGVTNIQLVNDIVLTEAIEIPAPATTTYSRAIDYTVIDLNGKSITIDSAYNDAASTASSAIVNNGNVILTGKGTVKASNNYTVRNYGNMIIDGITVENGIMNFADLTVESGNISNSRSGKHTIYGNGATLTINGGTFYNGNPGNAAIFSYAGEVEINGGEFSIADGTATLGWTSCLLDAQGNAKFTINGGTINGEIRDYNKNTTVLGGTFDANPTQWLASGYTALQNADGTYTVLKGDVAVYNSDALVDAINAGKKNIVLAAGDYALRFTNNTAFNLDGATLVGLDGTKLSISSSEASYGRIQADNVTFENITFTNGTVGATGKATYNDCTFEGVLECASSNAAETYVNDCVIKGYIHTATDMNAGAAFVTNSKLAGAEYNAPNGVTFTNCEIGEINIWGGDTVLNGCTYTTIVNMGSGSVTVDGATYVANADALATAVAAGATNILLADGEYNVKNCGGKTLTISGSKNAVIKVYNEGELGSDYGFDGSTVTFNGVTFDTTDNNGNYKGFARMKGIYNNCTFEGSYALNNVSEFTKCTFNVSGDAYNLWTWGAPTATLNSCIFNSDGKAVLLYGGVDTQLTVNDCVFNDNGGLTDLKAAIEIGNDYGRSYTLIVNNTTVNGYEINDKGINTGSTLWGNKNSMGTDKLNVIIDGVDVY